VRSSLWQRLGTFFVSDWPRSVRSLWKETLVSLALTLIGAVTGYLLVVNDSSWYSTFIPEALASGRDFNASNAFLRSTLYESHGAQGLGFFATFLFSHNSQVSIKCFALGFAFAVPTVVLLVYNGTMLGAILALYSTHGLAMPIGGWLIIHGTTEIFAIVLAGAAGIRIGWSVVFPGARPRLEAAALGGRSAALVMGGVVVMLLCAGLLEGYGRQLVTSDIARYAIGLAMLCLWLTYFYWPRSRTHAHA
jgi:uncharacterized membrane protein SpoIIM required for sporulation